MKTNLDQLYSLRRDFSVIGLTGRTGSGCSEVSKILNTPFNELENISSIESFSDGKFKRKFQIVNDFCKENWKEYKVIEYKRVLLFLLIPTLISNPKNKLLFDYYKLDLNGSFNDTEIKLLKTKIQRLIQPKVTLVKDILEIKSPDKVSTKPKLRLLYQIFWGDDFNELADKINNELFDCSFLHRKFLLHTVSNNYRRSKQPFNDGTDNPDNIFYIAKVINRIIKATHLCESKCHVVIDSLKNSLEINFFKERYSAFYQIAVKNDNRSEDLLKKYKTQDDSKVKILMNMDDVEYKVKDYENGIFFSPDIQNCIQMSDYHINKNPRYTSIASLKNQQYYIFYSLEEQLLKLQTIIQQPGLITPEPIERIMQLAFTVRLNSGCISRQVGAVVTDEDYSVKAVGWNDSPAGSLPCSLRNVKEIDESPFGFTKFELGEGTKETEIISEDEDGKEIDSESKEFHTYLKENFTEKNYPKEKLKGRNCPFCFKSAYNAFSGEKNQVHTRSLHAEENAMLQITKYGGQPLVNGNLFTTASPCELCAKKAYQLGIKKVFYIDPYPGISRNHILKSNANKDPKMILFIGAVGIAYNKFYTPFMSQKDELALLTGHSFKEPEKVTKKKVRNILAAKIAENDYLKEKLDELLKGDEIDSVDELLKLVEKGLRSEDGKN